MSDARGSEQAIEGSTAEGPGVAEKRITFVQFGDYAEASERFAAGGKANYYAQEYTVDFLSELARRPGIGAVTVVCFAADRPKAMHGGVATLGVRLYPQDGRPQIAALLRAVAETRPTHLVVAAPIADVIRWGIAQGLPTLPLFADSFRAKGFRSRVRNFLLARLLNRPELDFVANHNLAASLDLERIGVRAGKILPFDWPEMAAKAAPKDAPAGGAFRMLYVGQVTEAKGVGDALRALALLRDRGVPAELTLIGAGETEAFTALAQDLGVGAQVVMRGKIDHDAVLAEMRAHDVVLVPSRHAYPEGLPMTLYEALCMRTPLVVSDHPMFALRIRDGKEALVHREADPVSLAARLEELFRDPALYRQLSRNAVQAVEDYLCPLKWDRLISDFLDPVARKELSRFALSRMALART